MEESHNQPEKPAANPFIIPGAILVAGVLIAGAIFFTGDGNSPSRQTGSNPEATSEPSTENIQPVTPEDHILGDINAPVKIVEFSDFECPFCKQFHQTMKRVMEEYGSDGRVAWVYRQFPIRQLHPRAAFKAAVASECAAEIGGNLAFWDFADRYFAVTPSNDRIDLSRIPQIAVDIGLDREQFNACLETGDRTYADQINSEIEDAFNSGAEGTPYSVIIAANGTKFPVSGAVPYEQMRQIIERALQEI